MITFDSHSVPEDLGALTVSVFVPQDKTDVLLNEMEVHFSKYAADQPMEMLFTIRDDSNYKLGNEVRNMLNSYYLPMQVYHLLILLSFLALDIAFIYYQNKKIKNNSISQLIKGAYP